jgi:hypothetical protein
MDILDIGDRQKSYDSASALFAKLELGLRAAAIMYDEYSSDLKSKENIFRLKENIDYRLSSALHHLKLLLREHGHGEQYLSEQTKDNPFRFEGFIMGNPYFERVERDISALFDSIVFNITSCFDYLSHIICYICQTNKQDTLYWTRLAKSARGQYNDISKSLVKTAIDQVDRVFVAGLYDYRSRLIHYKRDLHKFTAQQDIANNRHRIRILVSSVAKSDFKKLSENGNDGKEFSLTYLSIWLFRQTADHMELLLDGLVDEIRQKSNYFHNLRGHKGKNTLILMQLDPDTNTAGPLSESFWKQYKETILP